MKKVSLTHIFTALSGLILGMAIFTFFYGKGYSYLSNDSKACVNCHIMRDQYESWKKNPHASHTTCNSCHTAENFYYKYFNKVENGFNHALKFTTGIHSDPIKIREHNFNITMQSCLRCHSQLIESIQHQNALTEGRSCVQCHQNVGHDH